MSYLSDPPSLKLVRFLLEDESLEKLLAERIANFKRSNQIGIEHKALNITKCQDHIQQITYRKKMTPYWFITINAKPTVSFQQLSDSVEAYFLTCTNAYWVFETTKNNHLHCHCLAYIPDYTKNTCNRMKNHFITEDICGTKKHIYVKWITKEDVPITKNYLDKSEQIASKQASNKLTIAWRKSKSIKKFYQIGNILTC